MYNNVTEFAGFKIYEFDVLDSTNNQAKVHINSGIDAENSIIIAKRQTAGRGRNGRDWVSDEGNIFLSIIIKNKNAEDNKLFSFITAIAIHDMLKNLGLISEIKWPNDVLVEGKKISGILLEQHKDFLIIGVGINVVSYPEYIESMLGVEATSINYLINPTVETADVIREFILFFGQMKNIFKQSGFEPLREIIIQNAYNIGNNIKVNVADKVIEGTFTDIDITGNLILLITTGEHLKINSGEVFGL